MKLKYIILLSLIVSATTLSAQSTNEINGYNYTLDRIEAKSNWLSSDNPSGLITNSISKSFFEASYDYHSGTFRNVTDGSNLNRFNLKTESFRRFNRFSVYGRLEYLNDRADDRSWYGTMHPEKTVMIVGDSIPGKTREEYYMLDGGFGYDIGCGFSIGATINYEAAVLAKRKDARNLNNYMNLRIRPGVMYRSKLVNVGINFDFDRFTQSVDYSVFGTNSRIPGSFFFDGMWFYRTALVSSTASSYPVPRHKGMTYGGSGQLEWNIASDFKFFNQFSLSYGTIDRYSRKGMEMMGSEERLDYKYLGILSLSSNRMDHILKLTFSYGDLMKFNNNQRLEQVPGTRQTERWYQYGKVLKLKGNTKTYGADYKLYLQRNDCNSSWIVHAGVEYYEKSMEYRILPVFYTQQIKFARTALGITKNVVTGRSSFLDLTLNADAFFGGKGFPFKENAPAGLVMNQVNIFLDLVYQEYNYLTAKRYILGGTLRFTHDLPTRIPMSIYAQVSAPNTSVSSGMPDTYRRGVMATIGLNF